MNKFIIIGCLLLMLEACASPWKITGGPQACKKMCENWGLEFTAMVGVGSQAAASGGGATACVCQPKPGDNKVSLDSSAGISTGMMQPITAIQAANAAAAAQAMQLIQNRQNQSTYNSTTTGYRY